MQQTLTKTNEVDKLVKQTVLDMGYSSVIPSDSQRGINYPPTSSTDRAVNIIEIKDFVILWTYSQ